MKKKKRVNEKYNKYGIWILCIAFIVMLYGCSSASDSNAASGNMDGSTAVTTDEAPGCEDYSEMPHYDEPDIPDEIVFSDYQKQVFMIYMVGSNLETDGKAATMDIQEMLDSSFDGERMDVYICTGGAKEWHMEGISSVATSIYKIENSELVLMDYLGDGLMSDKATLTGFINYCYEDSDGDCYSLILWNHGAGAVLGFGADELNNYAAMSIADIGMALGDSEVIQSGRRFEMIGFDACLMGMLEVANSLSFYSHYMVASEELMPGMGWDYLCLADIASLDEFRGDEVGQIIIDSFAEYYKGQSDRHTEYSLACYDLSKAVDLMECFEGLVNDEIIGLSSGEYATISRCRSNTKAFGHINGEDFYDTVDLYDYANNIEELYAYSAEDVMNAIDEMVIYYRSNILHSHGVAVYFPYTNQVYMDSWVGGYGSLQFSYMYEAFLDAYMEDLIGEAMAVWESIDIRPADGTKSDYHIYLSDDQIEVYSNTKNSKWIRVEDSTDTYGCFMIRSDTKMTINGDLITEDYEDKIFVFENLSGDEISFTMNEIDKNEEYAIYEGQIRVLPDGGSEWHDLTVCVKVDEEHPDGEIINCRELCALSDMHLFPSVQEYRFNAGDQIQGVILSSQISMDDSGLLLPKDRWANGTNTLTDVMIYDGAFEPRYVSYDESMGMAFSLYFIEDTRGYTHSAGIFNTDGRDDRNVYLGDGDDSLTISNQYNKADNKVALFDTYNRQVCTLSLSDVQELDSKTKARKIIINVKDITSNKKAYDIRVSYDLNDIYADYIEYGMIPSGDKSPFFYCNVVSEMVNDTSVYIMTYNKNQNNDEKGKMVLVPYVDCYGEQRYMTIECDKYDDMINYDILESVEMILK